jgi:shikimate kinase
MEKKQPNKAGIPLNIILVGMPGSGKTTVGVNLSRLIHKRFVDTDRLLVKQFKMPITTAFATHGEPAFRDAESAVCEAALAYRHCVISTGGGIIVRPVNRTLLRATGKVIYLQLSLEMLWNRLKKDRSRPLLKTDDPYATLCALFETRDPLYRDCAHEVISISNQTPLEVAQLIANRLIQRT